MAGYAELFDLATDATFQKRVRFAMLRAAYDIKNEVPGTANHATRIAWATDVFNQQDNLDLGRICLGVLLNPVIGAAGAGAPDADIQFQVNVLINELTS